MKKTSKPRLTPKTDFGLSNNPRASKADITNAPHLFGDPFDEGDFDELLPLGDSDDYGDSDYGDSDDYGDPSINNSTLALFKEMSGDPLYGAPKMPKLNKKQMIALGLGGAALIHRDQVERVVRKLLTHRKQMSSRVINKLRTGAGRQTLQGDKRIFKTNLRINRRSTLPFFQITGAKLNSSPINPNEVFPADMLKFLLDRQAADTPFLQESAVATLVGPNWVSTATGVVADRYYTALILQIGINILNAAPGSVFSITGTFPTVNGPLVVAGNPWIFTIERQFDVRFVLYPWQLVTNRPFIVQGLYNNANPIITTVAGLPAASAVTLIVPGSLHKWIVKLREALIRG